MLLQLEPVVIKIPTASAPASITGVLAVQIEVGGVGQEHKLFLPSEVGPTQVCTSSVTVIDLQPVEHCVCECHMREGRM